MGAKHWNCDHHEICRIVESTKCKNYGICSSIHAIDDLFPITSGSDTINNGSVQIGTGEFTISGPLTMSGAAMNAWTGVVTHTLDRDV